MTTSTHKITVDEFWAMPEDPGHRFELVDGVLVDMDGTPRHGRVTIQLGRLLSDHLDQFGLPFDVGASTGFAMGGDTLRFPDVHVTTWERMSTYDEADGAWPLFAPDVAIEVVSASNTPSALDRKTAEYFAGGALAVWIADPVPRTVKIRRPLQPEQVFGIDDILTGDPEVPGFFCAVADIFAVLDRGGKPAPEDG